MRNSGYLAFCCVEECSDLVWIFRIRFSQIDQVHHRFERIVHLMRNRSCHPAGGSDLFSFEEGGHRSLFARNVAEYLRCPYNRPGGVSYWRDAERYIEAFAALCETHSLIMVDALSCPNLCKDCLFLVTQFRRNEQKNGPAEDFFAGIAEDPSGCLIPTRDLSCEIFTQNGVIGRLNDGCYLTEPFG